MWRGVSDSAGDVCVERLESGADEAGVEGAGEGDVGGALDDGAAVGEEGEGVGAAAEAEEEVVGAEVLDVGVGGEAGAQGGEVDGAVVLVDLDGVAAAEGDVGAVAAGEVGEDALAADFAVGARGGGGDLGAVECAAGGVPEIEGEQGAAHEVGLAGEELEGFGDLDGGGEIDGGGEDAGGVAGFDVAGGGLGKMQARQAVGEQVRGSRFEVQEGAAGRMFMVAA